MLPRLTIVASTLMVAMMHTTLLAEAGVFGDYHWRTHTPSKEQEPFMARYITASRINYPKKSLALEALQMMQNEKLSFMEEMRKQANRNNRNGRNREEQFTGDLGMLSYQQLEEEAAIATFDVRVPPTRDAHTIVGPVCTSYGCALYAVYDRYRKSFFSREWLDVEKWCEEQEMEMGQFLQMVNSQDIIQMVARIWPNDEVRDRKGKLAQVKADLSRMKHGDPSTTMGKLDGSKRPVDKEKHADMMSIRNDFFAKVVTPEVVSEHPEVFALSLEEIVESGWVSPALLKEHGFDVAYGVVPDPEGSGEGPQPVYGDGAPSTEEPASEETYDEKDEF